MTEQIVPTPEQNEIIAAAVNSTANLQLIARAGAAKTTTLVLIAEALPDKNILCLAFNKKIALEMGERLPANCTAQTLNSLGHRAFGSFLGKRLKLDFKKNYNIISGLIAELDDPDEKNAAWETFADTMRSVDQGKACGWIPDRLKGHWKAFRSDDEFFGALEYEPTDLEMELIEAATCISFKQSLEGVIDFSDQILMSACCAVPFLTYDLILVDEAQDLSALNHEIIRKLKLNKRLIAVGDPCQAIYAFRGANSDSMQILQRKFQMEVFYLTTSFRCAKEIIRNVHWRAPDMQWPDWAVEGEVNHPSTWDQSLIPDGAAVICRNNAPLFKLGIRLIRDGRLPHIAGRDVAFSLVKTMKKLGKGKLSREGAIRKLDLWKAKELERSRMPETVTDKHECILIFLEITECLGDAIAYLEAMMQREGALQLMTGHKAKGLEFDTVFFLNKDLINKRPDNQDHNLQYVIETRAKRSLYYVENANYILGIDKEEVA